MGVFAWSLLLMYVSLVWAQNSEVDDDQVLGILGEVSLLLRHQHGITKPMMMEPSLDLISTSLLENDLRLTVPQATRILEHLRSELDTDEDDDSDGGEKRRAFMDKRVYSKPASKWKFPIAYTFDGSHSDKEKTIIRGGFERWRTTTCASFKEYPTESAIGNQPHIVVTKGNGCWSYVGKTGSGGQALSLGNNCVTSGIASHEIGHALGLWHEHMRNDRDNYISVNWANMVSGYESAFTKVPPSDDIDYGTGYDVTSVMHYDSLGFSTDYWGKKRVIVPKNMHHLTSIGNREYLSFADVKRINFHYGCITESCAGITLSQPCQNGGYQDPLNCAKCRCPLGLGGDYCQDIAPSSYSCGGTIDVPRCSSASISTPSYPLQYSAGTTCSWKIQSSGGLIFAFETQPNLPAKPSDSCIDFVEINSNMDQLDKPGDRFCMGGKSSGRIAIADSGKALVTFSSKSAAQGGGGHTGFKLIIYSTCAGMTSASNLTDECSFTSTGYDYEGSTSKSDAGACSAWAGQSNIGDLSFPDTTLLDAGSACRNPDSRSFPWCYTSRSYTSVGYCKSIPKCPTGTNVQAQPTLTANAATATIRTTTMAPTTVMKKTKATKTHKIAKVTAKAVPVPDVTTTPKQTITSSKCRPTKEGRGYIGHTNVTRSGVACQRWGDQRPHHHIYTNASMFPDGSIEAAANYCRNPEPSYGSGVWCLTKNSALRWEPCSVPLCGKKRRQYNEKRQLITWWEDRHPRRRRPQ